MTKTYEVFVFLEDSDNGDSLGEVQAETALNALSFFMRGREDRKVVESKDSIVNGREVTDLSYLDKHGNLWTLSAWERTNESPN